MFSLSVKIERIEQKRLVRLFMLTQDGLSEMSQCSSGILISNVKSFQLHVFAPPSKSEERTPQNQIWVRDRRRKVEQKIEKGVSRTT